MDRLKQLAVPLTTLSVVLFIWWGWVWAAPRAVLWIFRGADHDNLAMYGQFGDLFGGVNSLFTALALAAVVWTAWMQKQQLDVQAEELRDQRESALEDRKQLAVQVAESTFFRQIELFHGMVRGLKFIGANGIAAESLDALHSLANGCRDILKKIELENLPDPDLELAIRNRANFTFGPVLRSLLDPLMRSIYYTIDLLDDNGHLTAIQRRSYVNILRGMFSIDLLYVLGIFAVAFPELNLRSKVQKYALLKHLPQGAPASILRRCYEEGAFVPGNWRQQAEA